MAQQITVAEIQQFLITMAALSAGAQQLTDYLFKKRFQQLDQPSTDPVIENRRQSTIHLITAVIGMLLAEATGIRPLTEIQAPFQGNLKLFEIPITGLLVSYGGSFFNEAIGVLSEFKDAQSALKDSIAGGKPSPAPGAADPPPAAPAATAVPGADPNAAGATAASSTTSAANDAGAPSTTSTASDEGGFFDAAHAG